MHKRLHLQSRYAALRPATREATGQSLPSRNFQKHFECAKNELLGETTSWNHFASPRKYQLVAASAAITSHNFLCFLLFDRLKSANDKS